MKIEEENLDIFVNGENMFNEDLLLLLGDGVFRCCFMFLVRIVLLV